MAYDPERHHRQSIRLKGYDYSRAGAYFVTVCTQGRACLFGDVVNGEMRVNELGEIVNNEWLRTEQIRPHVELDEFIVMPNHIHAIIWIVTDDSVGATRRVAPTKNGQVAPTIHPYSQTTRPCGPKSQSIGAIIGQFKSVVTKRINQMRGIPGAPVWQRNYYEHIIRNDESLNRIREYIANNPLQWTLDREKQEIVQATSRSPQQMDELWRI